MHIKSDTFPIQNAYGGEEGGVGVVKTLIFWVSTKQMTP